VKSDRPDLALTIATLVRSAGPVTPIETTTIRLTRWVVASTGLMALSVLVAGIRPDVAARIVDAWFLARGAAAFAIVLAAATVAFATSVPGREPSAAVRALAPAACLAWGAMLITAIAATQSPLDQMLHVPFHPSCVALITAAGVPPGALLVRMLRRAAPLQARLTAAATALASLASGALAAQFVCADDGAAHHLVWHFAPVVLLTIVSVVPGSSLFGGSLRRSA